MHGARANPAGVSPTTQVGSVVKTIGTVQRFAAAVALLSLFAAAALTAQGQTLSGLKIATPGNDGNAGAWYAQEFGIFKKYGIDAQVEAIRRGSGAAIAAAVVSGAADIGEGDLVAVAAAREHGIPLTLLAPSFLYRTELPIMSLVVAKNSPVKSAKDLNGKIIGVLSLEGPAKLAVIRWLQREGADVSTVKLTEITPSSAGAAVAQGTIAAATLNEPFLTTTLAADTIRELGHPYDAFGKQVQVSAWFAKEEWVKANPDLTQRFVKAMRETATFANDPVNWPKTGAILQKYDGFPPELISKMRRSSYGTTFSVAVMQPILDGAVEQKSIPSHIDAKDMINGYALSK
jgi:NitT/TauT family transport system substrate-binding protein